MNLKDKTVVIDNKTYRYSKIVMLETNNKSNIYIGNDLKTLYKGDIALKSIDNTISQHLYFLSSDKICEGDWVYHPEVSQEFTIIKNDVHSKGLHPVQGIFKYKNTTNPWYSKCSKIIASTDPSLNLPKSSDSFLQVYIDAYNKNEKIEECLVEYEPDVYKAKMPINFLDYIEPGRGLPIIEGSEEVATWKLKTTKEEIIIRKVKDSWSREEVIKLLHKYVKESTTDYKPLKKYFIDKVNTWISQNL